MQRFLLLALALLPACGGNKPTEPFTLYAHGKVWTGTGGEPNEAILAQGSRVVATGTTKALASRAPAATVVELGGRTVVPGLVDTHSHVAPLGAPAWFVNDPSFVERGEQGPTAQEVAQLVSARAAEVPVGTPVLAIVGPAYYATAGENPRALLDGAASRNPVATVDWTGHGISANSAMLSAAGFMERQADPYGGRLSRSASGTLTGYVQELAEIEVFRYLASILPDDAYVGAYEAYARAALSYGVTSVVDIPFVLTQERAARIHAAQSSPLHFTQVCLLEQAGQQCPALGGAIRRKLFLDGGPSDCTTFVSIPYRVPEGCPAATPGWLGRSDVSGAELDAVLQDVRARGGELLVHALGDSAVDMLFTHMEVLAPAAEWKGRVSLEHGDLIRPADIARAAQLGVAVVQNPTHLAVVPPLFSLRYEPALFADSQPLQSLLSAGLPLAFGSDAFSSPSNPWLEILLASTHPARPSEALSRAQALLAYTATASQVRELPSVGTLTPGKEATFAVLTQDALTVPPEALAATRSSLTVVAGQVAWSDGAILPATE